MRTTAVLAVAALALAGGAEGFVGTGLVGGGPGLLRLGGLRGMGTPSAAARTACPLSQISMQRGGRRGGRGGRGGAGGAALGPGKKAGRMGKMVMQELMGILRGPVARNIDDEMLAQAMLLKVSIVDVEMSPDVKVAKVHVSVIGEEALQKEIVAWMQENNKQLRYELAQAMRHLRTVPTLRFVSADVGAAMDVMSILDKISKERVDRQDDEEDDEGGAGSA